MIGEALRSLFVLPVTRGLDIDDPRTTEVRRQVILEKRFLRRIYQEWYSELAASAPSGEGAVLEIGSGAGFLSDLIPGLITSDVLRCSGVDLVMDALQLPFEDGCLRAILMTNVLHHLPEPRRFFAEAARCVRPGGVVAMIEPWVSSWSRRAYALHSEPFLPEAQEWTLPSGGPLTGANGALAWILFERDRAQFQAESLAWQIAQVRPMMPFRYLWSGGVSMRSLMPAWSFSAWRWVEKALEPWMDLLAMFAFVSLRRR